MDKTRRQQEMEHAKERRESLEQAEDTAATLTAQDGNGWTAADAESHRKLVKEASEKNQVASDLQDEVNAELKMVSNLLKEAMEADKEARRELKSMEETYDSATKTSSASAELISKLVDATNKCGETAKVCAEADEYAAETQNNAFIKSAKAGNVVAESYFKLAEATELHKKKSSNQG